MNNYIINYKETAIMKLTSQFITIYNLLQLITSELPYSSFPALLLGYIRHNRSASYSNRALTQTNVIRRIVAFSCLW